MLDLKTKIIEELTEIFQYDLFDDPKTETADKKAISIYNNAPPLHTEGDDDSDDFPYILVRYGQGTRAELASQRQQDVDIIVGVFSTKEDGTALDTVTEIIDKIVGYFEENNYIAAKYSRQWPIDWTYPSEDTWPYAFGGITVTFTMPSNSLKGNVYD